MQPQSERFRITLNNYYLLVNANQFLMKKQWIGILIVGMSLGTAWAVRGQFGHEQGAAWAGGIGAMSLVLVSGRKPCGHHPPLYG